MKLEQAITIAETTFIPGEITHFEEFRKALKLLIEAGKHILNLRETGVIDPDFLLPGETRE